MKIKFTTMANWQLPTQLGGLENRSIENQGGTPLELDVIVWTRDLRL
jgi:hypothetical protein